MQLIQARWSIVGKWYLKFYTLKKGFFTEIPKKVWWIWKASKWLETLKETIKNSTKLIKVLPLDTATKPSLPNRFSFIEKYWTTRVLYEICETHDATLWFGFFRRDLFRFSTKLKVFDNEGLIAASKRRTFTFFLTFQVIWKLFRSAKPFFNSEETIFFSHR